MDIKSNEKKIIICESSKQAYFLHDTHMISGVDSRILATNPDAIWALRNIKADYFSIEQFQQNKTVNQIEHLQAEQIRWANNVDTFLQETNPEFKKLNFCPARYYLIHLKNTWDTFIHRADLLENLEDLEHPDSISFFINPRSLTYDTNFLLQGSPLSECIPSWAEYHGIKITPFPSLPGDLFWVEQIHIRNSPWRTISKSPQFIVSTLRKKFHSIFNNPLSEDFLHLPLLSGKKTKIFMRSQYDITQNISNLLHKYNLTPVSFDDAIVKSKEYAGTVPSIDQPLIEAWQHITELEWFWQPEGWQEWSLRSSLEPLFHHFWFDIIPVLWKSMNGSRILIKKQYPQAICVSLLCGADETGFIMGARAEKIPVIMYQHGASMGDIENTIWDLTDSYYSDYLLVYGKGEEEYIRSRSAFNDLNVTLLSVGSTRLDDIAHRPDKNSVLTIRRDIMGKRKKPLVVYIPGLFINYYRFDKHNQRDCSIFESRQKVFKLFDTHQQVHFAYKTFTSAGNDPTLDMLKETCPNCSIINNISLTKIQWAADLLIHEMPSTGMYEGLVTDKPMIVYVDRDIYRMPAKVKEMLGKRAVIAETNDDLIKEVKQFLEIGDFSPLVDPNREFVKTFCTHLDDGQSAARAAKAIYEIAKNHLKVSD